jgi:hypothetical protein
MADISRLSRLVAGVQRHVDLSQNSLIVGSLKVGTSSPTELTKALLDSLLAIRTDLASNANALGASLVGIEDAAAQFTATNVEAALAESLDAAQAAQADATQALSDAADAQQDIDDHLADSADAHDASAISSVPAGNLAATNVQAALNELDSEKIALTEKGAANGVATLDGGGKIPVAQLPSAVMTYEGIWDASANDPQLQDGTGDAGMVYRVSVAGTQDLGSGNQTFSIGDWVVYNGSIWQQTDNADAVMSVNGMTGVVVLDSDDIAEGAANLYYTQARFDSAFAAKDTDDLDEGSTNLYYTNARFDTRFATKDSADLNHTQADASDWTVADGSSIAAHLDELADRLVTVEAGSASLKETLNAGEAMASATLFAVRWAKAADAGFVAGRVYKADKDASSVDNFHVMGLVRPSTSLAAGDPVTVTKAGLLNAPSHGFTVGAPIYLNAAGALSNTAPSAADEAVVKVAMARDANNLEVQIQIMGVN